MANISLSQVRDLWKRVSDWISGATADKPGVTVYGSDDGGTTRRAVSTDESGALKTQLTGNIVDGTIETLGSRAQLWKTNPTSSMSIMEAIKGIMSLMEDGTPGPSRLAQIQTLLEALGAMTDAAQVDPAEAATAIAALKGLLTLTAQRASEITLAQIKTALTDGSLKAQLSGSLVESELNAKTGLVIAAGATATAIGARSIRGRRCTFIAEPTDGSTSSMAVGYRLWTQANRALAGADTMAPDVYSEATSITFDVTAPKAYFRVKNGATAEKTFDCHLYFWPN